MSWIVRHKNPKVTKNKDGWSVDGIDLGWNKTQAEFHALLCEFEAQNITYEIVEVKEKTDLVEDINLKMLRNK